MRSLLTLLFIALGLPLSALNASLSYATFQTPSQKYLELYLHLDGSSLAFALQADSSRQAAVEVVVLIRNEDEAIVKADKFVLRSPLSRNPIDFVDVKRYALPNGQYKLIVALTDQNLTTNAKEYQTSFEVNYDPAAPQLSDIQLLSSVRRSETAGPMVKSGLWMEPLAYNLYGRNASRLSFYLEVYHTRAWLEEDFQLTYRIQNVENQDSRSMIIGHKRLSPKLIVPVLIQQDISEMASGQYSLTVEIRNDRQELLDSRSLLFSRYNPRLEPATDSVNLADEFVSNIDSVEMAYVFKALMQIMNQEQLTESKKLIRDKDLEGQRSFLYDYFAEQNPTNPALAYSDFLQLARKVDEMFYSGFRRGFETDRGSVYLRYGPPNDTEMRDQEPSAPPYEVWSYYEFPQTGQNNVKFLFYNPSLAPGDFQLLTSNAIGEVNNPQWQRELYKNAPADFKGNYFDNPQVGDGFNRNATRVITDY